MSEEAQYQSVAPKAGWTRVQLPSRGQLYEGRVPEGFVNIRKPTAQEESILFSQGAGGVERVAKVIDNCCELPNAFPPRELLLTDRMAIMLYIRSLTFGTQYRFPFKCQFCGATAKATIDIAEDLDESTPAEDLQEPFALSLPDCGRALELRFLRGNDEDAVVKKAKRTKMQSNDPGDPSYLFRIARMIVTVDGEELNAAQMEQFVRGLSMQDTGAIRNIIDKTEPGIDTTVFPDCPECGATNEFPMPFSAEFFRPTGV